MNFANERTKETKESPRFIKQITVNQDLQLLNHYFQSHSVHFGHIDHSEQNGEYV